MEVPLTNIGKRYNFSRFPQHLCLLYLAGGSLSNNEIHQQVVVGKHRFTVRGHTYKDIPRTFGVLSVGPQSCRMWRNYWSWILVDVTEARNVPAVTGRSLVLESLAFSGLMALLIFSWAFSGRQWILIIQLHGSPIPWLQYYRHNTVSAAEPQFTWTAGCHTKKITSFSMGPPHASNYTSSINLLLAM